MTDKEKVKQYLKLKDIGRTQFSEVTGFSSSFLDSGTSLGVDKLKIIVDNFPDFNVWALLKDEENLIAEPQSIRNTNSPNSQNNNINKVSGNVTISHNDISNLIELNKELNKRLETSQNQVNILLDILKTK